MASRFGFDNSEKGPDSVEQNAPHPFEVIEQSEQEGLDRLQEEQDSNIKQASIDSKFTCEADSPALVMYDREAQGLYFCNRGAWSPIASKNQEQGKGENLGQAPMNTQKFARQEQFVIRPSTDSFLCTQSENFPKSYICSKQDRLLKKANKHQADTVLTKGH